MNKLVFHHTKGPRLRQVRKLRAFILDRCHALGYEINSLLIIFVDDETLLQMNRDYLQHDYYTDILTFDMSTRPKIIEGEVYISMDRVQENANHYQVSYASECHRIIFHGILHLVGFSDHTTEEKQRMTQQEDDWLSSYFHP